MTVQNYSHKAVMQDRARAWHEYAGAYRELGDDHQAFNTLRVSFQKLKQASGAFPDDSELYRNMYQYACQMANYTPDVDERIVVLERAAKLVAEAETTGALHAEDEALPEWIEQELAHNRKMAAATSVEEKQAIIAAYFEARGLSDEEIHDATIELEPDGAAE